MGGLKFNFDKSPLSYEHISLHGTGRTLLSIHNVNDIRIIQSDKGINEADT